MVFIDVEVYYTRKTPKAYLLRLLVDGKEVWFPKTTTQNVMESPNVKQKVKIADFILDQKGYADIEKMKVLITDDKGICIECGKETIKPEFKYCKNCYGRIRNKKLNKEEIKNITPKIVDIKGFCANCGFTKGYEGVDGKIFCVGCEIKLADGVNDWIEGRVIGYKCKKCGKGSYEPYGFYVIKCNNCNHMIGFENVPKKSKILEGYSI